MNCERFAPSPTGLLHLGHAFSALTAFNNAKATDARFLLRIEDIDQPRCRPEFEASIYSDLEWLGLEWEEPALRQSERMGSYKIALQSLQDKGLLYRCICKRSDIKTALSALQEGDAGFDIPNVYPRLCVNKEIPSDQNFALRLDMTRALDHLPSNITYTEIGSGKPTKRSFTKDDLVQNIGDVVLARKDIGTSYNLSVVVDDAFQGVTHVTRGEDMQDETPIHRVLQILLGLPEPVYRHHRLIRDENGKRLAKRDDARSIQKYREDGYSQSDIKSLLGL